ncbi:hypothetical protein PLESTB_000950100 [Pleodorina starrii]|uniref:Uncharacterized protein n=1 Tax=Pleodorina starrii TaxID=330485 RepID=A0A9W6BN96_9CHLO|nr:hypothetical protein PLESTM_001148700 [Pleodorina starrii]GLC55158.1 hypothetical protein PLESTB_000950100 [Pleodorina starrii]GLC71088.1 hypothetical protein PLESTF_001073300 [Pleodorina starrii]
MQRDIKGFVRVVASSSSSRQDPAPGGATTAKDSSHGGSSSLLRLLGSSHTNNSGTSRSGGFIKPSPAAPCAPAARTRTPHTSGAPGAVRHADPGPAPGTSVGTSLGPRPSPWVPASHTHGPFQNPPTSQSRGQQQGQQQQQGGPPGRSQPMKLQLQVQALLRRGLEPPSSSRSLSQHNQQLQLRHPQGQQQGQYQGQQQGYNQAPQAASVPRPDTSEASLLPLRRRRQQRHVGAVDSVEVEAGEEAVTAAKAGGSLLVLGDSSRRHAAAKRAVSGVSGGAGDGVGWQRAVRARGERERRFNHWDDGGGAWDCDTLGIEGADECDLRWEGVGTTAVGPRL